MPINRRQFLTTTTAATSSLLLPPANPQARPTSDPHHPETSVELQGPQLPDLTPARWIWLPSARTLPNTFLHLRRSLTLAAPPRRATGWIAADSRYLLELNGRRIQWGPPPADPRWPEADPIDLTASLTAGENILAATVLYYGTGDGTNPLGRPGFLFYLELEHADGTLEKIVSDANWHTAISRAWQPGRAKRWYVRALQEVFDARLHPYGWNQPGFTPATPWLAAEELHGSPNRPSVSTSYPHYSLDLGPGPASTRLRPRSIALMDESIVNGFTLSATHTLTWHTTPEDYFDFNIPNAFTATLRHNLGAGVGAPGLDSETWVRTTADPNVYHLNFAPDQTLALTFQLPEQVVGWPGFTIGAPAGTIVEMLVHEAHDLDSGPPLLNTHFNSWTRFLCREGVNDFATFDFESLRWLQLIIRNATGPITLSNLHVRRRTYPWAAEPHIQTSDPTLQTLFNASSNTLRNCAQETLVDGMARERQQYSGDVGHQIYALLLACNETRQPARFLTTFSQGLCLDGYFLDCWPAYDRLARLEQRQLGLTDWGPLLDHGVGFITDCYRVYLHTGSLDPVREPYPRLLRFARYLQTKVGSDGLLPVENLGVPTVWMDHVAFKQQRHKQLAFNLYLAAALTHHLAPLCQAFGDTTQAAEFNRFGASILRAAQARFWDPTRKLYVNNLPWLSEDKEPRSDDRSLATAILFDQVPGSQTSALIETLAAAPPSMGLSYPANACWRYWALAKAGRAEVIVSDLRTRWATMPSVLLNNTLQEDWHVTPDSNSQWSHCPVVPTYIAIQAFLGLRPLTPGFARYELRPQLSGLPDLHLTAHTPHGPIILHYNGKEATLQLPPTAQGELILPNHPGRTLPPNTTITLAL